MSRLLFLTSLTALGLSGAGASGLLLSEQAPARSTEQSLPNRSVARAAVVKAEGRLPRPDRTVTMVAGESLTEALTRAGVAGLDAALADQAASAAAPLPGRPIKLWLGRKLYGGTRLLERMEARTAERTILTVVRRGDDFLPGIVQVAIDDTPVRLRLGGGPALARELSRMELPESARHQLLSLGSTNDAAIDLIIAHEQSRGERHYGELLYVSVTDGSGAVQRWLGDGSGGLRTMDQSVEGSALQRPVAGPVTSKVGLRFHPVLRFLRWHRGTDFAAPAGAPVRAALPGRVKEAGWRGGYGQLVRLEHQDGSVTAYAHLSDILVTPGAHVSQGALLGHVGATGLATGPHLHFEWLRNGLPAQPQFAAADRQAADLSRPQRASLQALLAAPYREPPVS